MIVALEVIIIMDHQIARSAATLRWRWRNSLEIHRLAQPHSVQSTRRSYDRVRYRTRSRYSRLQLLLRLSAAFAMALRSCLGFPPHPFVAQFRTLLDDRAVTAAQVHCDILARISANPALTPQPKSRAAPSDR